MTFLAGPRRRAKRRALLLAVALILALAALVLGACGPMGGTPAPGTPAPIPRTPRPPETPTPAPVGPILTGFIPLRQGIGPHPTDMALDDKHHRLYVLCAEEVDIVDTRTLRVTRVPVPRGSRILGLDTDAQRVLLGGAGGSGPAELWVVDGATGTVVRKVALSSPPWRTTLLPKYNLAVAAMPSGRAVALNLNTGFVASFAAGGAQPIMETDAEAGKVYFSGATGPQGQEIAEALSVLDARTGRVDTVPLPATPTAFLVDERTHRLFILHQYAASMTVYSPDSGVEDTLALSGEPVEMALDAGANALYISDWAGGRLLIADTRRPAGLTAADLFPSAHFLQAQATVRRILVAQAGGGQAALVDRGRIIPLDLPGPPGSAAIHPASGVSYVVIPGRNLLVALAPDGAEFLRWTLPARPDTIILDAQQDRLFVSLPAAGAVAVIDLTTRNQDLLPHAVVPSAAVVHPADGMIYLADAVGATVYALAPEREQATRAISTGPLPTGLAVNRATGEVWIACADGLYAAAQGSKSASRVMESDSAPLLGVNSSLNQVYAGLSATPSAVQVLEGTTHRLLKTLRGDRLLALSVDETAGMLLTVWQSPASPGTLTLSLLDGYSLEETRIRVALPIRAGAPVAAWMDGARGVAVLAYGGQPGAVVLVDLAPAQVVPYAEIAIPDDIADEYVALTIAGDSARGDAIIGIHGDSHLLLLDTRSRISDTVRLQAGLASLALDESRNRVYAALLDGTVAIVDGATAQVVSQVAIGGAAHRLAPDPLRQRVFACSAQQATVYAIHDPVAEPTPEPATSPLPTPAPTVNLAGWTTFASGDEVRALLSDGRSVWAATGGGIVRWDAEGDSFRQFLAPQDGLRSNDAHGLARGPDGDIWAATGGGLSRYAGPDWATLSIGNSGALQGNFRAMSIGPDGTLWAGTQDGTVYAVWAKTIPQVMHRIPGQPITDIALDSLGRRWIASWMGVTLLAGDAVITYTAQNSGLPPGMVNALLVLTDSTILAATDTGLARFQNGVWIAYPKDSGAPSGVTALAQTADGALWAASPQGVYRYDERWALVGSVRDAAVQYAPLWRQEFARSTRWPMTAAGGRIWAILDTGLADFDGQIWTRRSTTGVAPPSSRARALALAPDGALWAGFAGSAPARYQAGRWTTFSAREQAPVSVNAILADPQGGIWFAADGGVALYDGQRWTAFKSGEAGLAAGRALSLAWDSAGALWVGTENGVSVRRKDAWTSYAQGSNGLPGGRVLSLAVDGEGVLWCATNRGIARYDGKTWEAYTDPAMPPTAQEIWGLALGGEGVRWFGARQSIRRLMGTSWFNYRHLPEAVGYDYARILQTANNPNPLWAVDKAHGKVWIAIEGGVAAYDGRNWEVYTPDNSGLASARVQAIVADERGAVWFATDRGISRFSP